MATVVGMSRAWLIRAGEDASALAHMLQANVIAVRYPQIQADARTMPAEVIEQLIRDSGRTQPGVRRVRLKWFANDVAIDDLVVTPDAARREIWFAEVVSDYRFEANPSVNGYFHVRDVKWLGAMDRDLLPEQRRLEVSRRPTIVKDLDFDWWLTMASSSHHPPNLGQRTRSAKSATTTSNKHSAQTQLACANPSCGLQYPAASMIDGLCPDCHSMT